MRAYLRGHLFEKGAYLIFYYIHKFVLLDKQMFLLFEAIKFYYVKYIFQWIEHECTTPGCREGYVTIDGNEKVRRPKCAVGKKYVRLVQ